MKGSTFRYYLADGQVRYGYVFDAASDGPRAQVKKRGFVSEKEADAALHAAITKQQTGASRPPAEQTLAELFDYWMKEYAWRKLSKKTSERYADSAQAVLSQLGHIPIQKLDLYAFERVLEDLATTPSKRGRPLSAKTIRNVASVFQGMFKRAIARYDVPLKRNPLVGVDLPKGAKRRVKTLEPEDIRKFAIQTLRESVNWMRPLAAMAAGSGARRGEMLAADWKSLNVRHGHIVFDKSLGQTREGVYVKATKSGEERVVPLPAFVLRELEVHRQRQEKHRAMFGEAYRTDLDLIFAEPDGNHLKPDSVTAKVCLVMRKLGLDGSLHTLRHSLASELFDVVPTTTISKRLGHSNVRTTTEIYSHGVRRRDTEAADAVEETLGPMFGDKVM